MDNVKRLLAYFLLGLTLSSCATTETSNETQTNDLTQLQGTIFIREKDIAYECSMPIVTGYHNVTDFGCTNDQAYSVRFANIPSAINIVFFDDKDCDMYKSWEIEVRTVKNPTTTDDYMNLGVMAGTADNTLIEPGVLKIRKTGSGTILGHLSCVYIYDNK